MATLDGELVAGVDQALSEWSQGDCVLGEHWFVFRIDPGRPLTIAAEAAAEEEVDLAEAEVRGLVVVTQTCDVVRSCADRPYVEVSPLVTVAKEDLPDIVGGRRPRYAYIPGIADQELVADLDRTMTVEKPLLASWERVEGCRDASEGRRLADSLARKRARFAFPDDFVALASKLRSRITSKHSKQSGEGDALRRLREIRVSASPDWGACEVDVHFWFIQDDDEADEQVDWSGQVSGWLEKVPSSGRFKSVSGVAVPLRDMTAQDYADSDRLDLDHLSMST